MRVARLAGGAYFGLFYSDGARFAVDREGRDVWADWPEGYALEDAATYLVGPVLGFVLRLRGITPLHASAIAVEDQAIAFVGVPGAGKSTTAAAFAHRGFAVLSDDVVALEDGQNHFLVAPGYPRVNLWPDSVRALLGSEDALPLITPTWGKHYLPLDQKGRRFQSKQLPLGAVYFLGERDPEFDDACDRRSGRRRSAHDSGGQYLRQLSSRPRHAPPRIRSPQPLGGRRSRPPAAALGRSLRSSRDV